MTACLFFCHCRYDDILINGLPDWRQPVFYYRRVRKMSNAELALLLFIILTVGHYGVVWSIYLEKQLVSIGNDLSLKSPQMCEGFWILCWSSFAHMHIFATTDQFSTTVFTPKEDKPATKSYTQRVFITVHYYNLQANLKCPLFFK